MSVIKITNWEKIKEDYILSNSPKNINTLILKRLANKHQVPYEDLKNRAAKGQWHKLKNQDNQELNTSMVPELSNEPALTEIEVREQNFNSATICLNKGLQKLSNMKCEEITPELAIKMAQLGLKGRHEAAGLQGSLNVNTGPNINLNINESSVEENINHQKKYKQLADRFINLLEQQGPDEVIDVKSTPNN